MVDLTPDFVRFAPTEEIAIAWLRQLGPEGSSVSGYNELLQARVQYVKEVDSSVLVGRLGDAWAWLVAHECVGQGTETGTWSRVTRQGSRLATRQGALEKMRAERALSGIGSDALRSSAGPAFVRGELKVAAFAAMTEVEAAVRELAALPSELAGVTLMTTAFEPSRGRLADAGADRIEQLATMHLFAGAMGMFKAPASFRATDYEDANEVADVIHLADLLLRMLRKMEAAGARDLKVSSPSFAVHEGASHTTRPATHLDTEHPEDP